MDVLLLLGRILYGALFLGSAMGHLTQSEAMAGYAASRGVPQARLATIGSGVVILVGALLVVLGVWADLGALLLLVFLVSTALLMHAFWKETDPEAKQMEMVQFNKDIALAGAALVLLWVYLEYDRAPLSLTDGLF